MSLLRDNGIIKSIMQVRNSERYTLPAIMLCIVAILKLYIYLMSNNCYKVASYLHGDDNRVSADERLI